jgi:uncharacterized protein YbcV (DUF1398 family)
MNTEHVRAVTECAARSASGSIHFGEVIARLTAVGIERYHADYSRNETTYYAADGSSCIVPMAHEPAPIADRFSAAAIETGVRMSQRGEIMYPQFTSRALAAGCVGYFVLLTGRCVQYFGRRGETHTEWFPGAAPSQEQ